MKKQHMLEIEAMCNLARTGDVLAVRTRGFWGSAIRAMLSRGLKQCHTNHNAPVYQFCRRKQTMQFEPPAAHEVELCVYLSDLYKRGGRAVLLRPDVYCDRTRVRVAATDYLWWAWRQMEGTPYDKRSIRMFMRMIFRKRAHVAANDKEQLYCTEGTLEPLTTSPFLPWNPDALKNEPYPAPIHVEQLVRQERLVFVAGNEDLLKKILGIPL